MFWHELLFVILCRDNDLLFDLANMLYANMLYLKLSIFISFLPGTSIANLNFLRKSLPIIGLDTSAMVYALIDEPFAATS